MGVFLLLVVGFSDKDLVIGLDNGLALTPPSKILIWKMKLCGFGNLKLNSSVKHFLRTVQDILPVFWNID